MNKLQSLDELAKLRKRLEVAAGNPKPTIVITAGTCGQASGANDLIRVTKKVIIDKDLTNKIDLRITGCHGFCEMEPSVLTEPDGIFYPNLTTDGMIRVLEAVSKGEIVEDLLYTDEKTGERIAKQKDIPFFKKQTRRILSQNEKIDPIRIFNYIREGGYSAIAKVMDMNNPDWAIKEVKKSGIRGRGGAAFPTGIKWEMLAKQKGKPDKYIVCNADEGNPGAFMDRTILEGNPQSVIEGMLIAGYTTGSNKGIVYIRHEYPLAIKHLIIAIRQARELGLLGENILGTGYSFDIEIVRGAGAYVCGEETSLIRSVEGKAGEPRQRPPFPIVKGIYGCPTCINNVETLANITVIINDSADVYKNVGVPGSTGTKIFSLVGKVKYSGLVEVPMGVTFNEIIYDIGGGPKSDAKLKAVFTGGPSGGCIPADKFDLGVDYDTLRKIDASVGSGDMIVLDEKSCMVDVAKYFMDFSKDESCGKCFTCRKGTQRLYELLDDITNGKATVETLDLLEELALVVKDTTMCGLGQTAPNPVLSSLQHFRNEYLEHILDKKCAAGVCKNLANAKCQSTFS